MLVVHLDMTMVQFKATILNSNVKVKMIPWITKMADVVSTEMSCP